jgi:hypothetical protein
MHAIRARNKEFLEGANKPAKPRSSEGKGKKKEQKEETKPLSRSTKLAVAGFLFLILGSVMIEVIRLFTA